MQQEEQSCFTLECPNTIFDIYIQSEDEGAKVQIFLNNIRYLSHLGLNDIYNWCNRQKVSYDTRFNYHRDMSLIGNMRSYIYYYRDKSKYQINYQPV